MAERGLYQGSSLVLPPDSPPPASGEMQWKLGGGCFLLRPSHADGGVGLSLETLSGAGRGQPCQEPGSCLGIPSSKCCGGRKGSFSGCWGDLALTRWWGFCFLLNCRVGIYLQGEEARRRRLREPCSKTQERKPVG